MHGIGMHGAGMIRGMLGQGGASPYPALLASLLAGEYWPLNEASGNRAGAINSLTLTDNATVTSIGGVAHTLMANFTPANSEYFSLADSAAISVGDIDFWWSFEVYMTSKAAAIETGGQWNSTGNQRSWFLRYEQSVDRFVMYVSSDGTYSAGVTGQEVRANNLGAPVINTLYHIVVYHDSVNNLIGICVNAGTPDTVSWSAGIRDSAASFRIGLIEGSTQYWSGRQGPICFGKGHVPTTAEIAYMYNGGITRAYPTGTGIGLAWFPRLLLTGGRLDAIDYLGSGILLIGSRGATPGHVYKSTDYGFSWTDKGNITGGVEITNVASAGSGTAYVLTGPSHVWKTTDNGNNWSDLGAVSSNTAHASYALTYDIAVTPLGTLLVADTTGTGGHIFRSVNGGTSWTDIGAVGSDGRYRFETVADGILINGLDGHVYKSIDDGLSWQDKGQLAASPTFATEYLGGGICLQATDNGHIFRSVDNGNNWTDLGQFSSGDGADDFVYLGNGIVVYSTYTGSFKMLRSTDYGATWTDIGAIATGVASDWLDHAIYVNDGGLRFGIGISTKGYVVRTHEVPSF